MINDYILYIVDQHLKEYKCPRHFKMTLDDGRVYKVPFSLLIAHYMRPQHQWENEPGEDVPFDEIQNSVDVFFVTTNYGNIGLNKTLLISDYINDHNLLNAVIQKSELLEDEKDTMARIVSIEVQSKFNLNDALSKVNDGVRPSGIRYTADNLSVWDIPIRPIIEHNVKTLIKERGDKQTPTDREIFDDVMTYYDNDAEGYIVWMSNHMKWEDVRPYATMVSDIPLTCKGFDDDLNFSFLPDDLKDDY